MFAPCIRSFVLNINCLFDFNWILYGSVMLEISLIYVEFIVDHDLFFLHENICDLYSIINIYNKIPLEILELKENEMKEMYHLVKNRNLFKKANNGIIKTNGLILCEYFMYVEEYYKQQ